ncbi:MAG TPA: FAD-dependent oxidoreductase [Solirubrobacteraceae bacterium]|nr:FAD-dependent oxidoreductase [Solirubrobacteraceae bacterium]
MLIEPQLARGSRIAVVGGGVSGLVAAHLLHPEHDVTVFEAGAYAGGHTNTIEVETDRGPLAVDTGFIVFNDRNYPRFEALLDELGVASQPAQMSFGVSDGDFEYASTTPNGLYAKRSHLLSPSFQRMVADVPRFQRAARELLAAPDEPSLREWLAGLEVSDAFVERVIVPQAAAVWSSDPDQMWTFPARFLVEFFDNHGMLGLRGRPRWRTVSGGSKRYVEALTAPFAERIRLSTPVRAIERLEDRVDVTPAGGEPESYDEVVIAAHADQALAMLADPTPAEREILGAFPYQANEAVLHTDRGLLPRRRRAWASWNYHLPPAGSARGPATVTYHMNRLQSLDARQDYCVTLNRSEAIDPAKIIRRIAYAHPVYTLAGQAAQRRYEEIGGRRRTHFCGAYWGWGFHEDGVASAHRAAAAAGRRAVPA